MKEYAEIIESIAKEIIKIKFPLCHTKTGKKYKDPFKNKYYAAINENFLADLIKYLNKKVEKGEIAILPRINSTVS